MRKINYFISRFASAACMLLACGAMFSCSDDDDNGGNGGVGQAPSNEDIGVTDRVVAINDGYGDWSVFNYTDGAMTSGRTMIDDLDFTISYSPFEIWAGVTEDDGFYEVYEEKYTNIRTNSFGAIVSADITYHEKDMYEEYEDKATMTASYDGNNRIQQLKVNSSSAYGDYSYEDNVAIDFTWDGNNVTEMNLVSEYRVVDEGDIYEGSENEAVSFIYGEGAVRNSGVYPPEFVLDLDFMTYAGFYGRTTADLPTTVISNENGRETRYDYEVAVDGQGRVTSISGGGDTQTYYYADTYNPDSYSLKAKTDGSLRQHSGALSKLKARILKHRLANRVDK